MALIDEVKQICDRLAQNGWRDLLLHHGLDITASNLKQELAKELQNIDRDIEGFEDFAFEGKRGIEAGNPAQSLLFHSLASPSVVKNVNGSDLTAFPTLAELDTVENYIYSIVSRGVEPPSLLDLRARAQGARLAIVVFASEYRPAPETVNRKHADMCFSRTGVARVGTVAPLYEPQHRGFLPFVEGDNKAFRVLPARYSAYIAVLRTGNQNVFGPMRFQQGDEERPFWVPLHKLFSGTECIRDRNLRVTLNAHHVNEKLRRIHLVLNNTGWEEPDISKPPFRFTDGIAELSNNPDFGTGLLIPVVHPRLVEPAEYKGKPLTFNVPTGSPTLSSSLAIPANNGRWRHAPEYVHARHQVLLNGEEKDLNTQPNVANLVKKGGYAARHYIDFTGDGWIEALCPELAVDIPRLVPAYSLITAPDFFPNCDQRELMDWWTQSVPEKLRKSIWQVPPETLSDERFAPNLELKDARFGKKDTTMTAIVSLPLKEPTRQMQLNVPETTRHSYLPDAASGVFAPGWDVSLDRTLDDGTEHLAAYGLGSPFPEDSKLCAALSTFWPSVAPDAARTFEPSSRWPTVSPLTDEEIGQIGNLPWDGVSGPRRVTRDGKAFVEYSALAYADYVENALQNKFSLALTGKVDVREYEARILAMARVYRELGIKEEDFFRDGMSEGEERAAFDEITAKKAEWSVLSFRTVSSADQELQQAQAQTNAELQSSPLYRFEIYRYGKPPEDIDAPRKSFFAEETVTLFVDPVRILLKREEGEWKVGNA